MSVNAQAFIKEMILDVVLRGHPLVPQSILALKHINFKALCLYKTWLFCYYIIQLYIGGSMESLVKTLRNFFTKHQYLPKENQADARRTLNVSLIGKTVRVTNLGFDQDPDFEASPNITNTVFHFHHNQLTSVELFVDLPRLGSRVLSSLEFNEDGAHIFANLRTRDDGPKEKEQVLQGGWVLIPVEVYWNQA
jgi:hypothetical protein